MKLLAATVISLSVLGATSVDSNHASVHITRAGSQPSRKGPVESSSTGSGSGV